MESTTFDHTHTLLLKHMTSHHAMGKIGCVLDKDLSRFYIEVDNDDKLPNLKKVLKNFQSESDSLQYGKIGLTDGQEKRAKLVFTHLDEIVIALYTLRRKPQLIKDLGHDIRIPYFPIKQRFSKWLQECIVQNQDKLESLFQQSHHPILFQALREYGHVLSNKTYQLFLKKILRETHERILSKLDENQMLFLKKLELHPKKYTPIMLADSRKGISYVKSNLKGDSHRHLMGVVEGYYHLYTHPWARWIPSPFNLLMRQHLRNEAKLLKIYEALRVIDSESLTEFPETEIPHHYDILTRHALHIRHKVNNTHLN
ncbi:MAG: hypothetical protein U1E78_08925 [Gammaproteobacteria bacterium]